MNDEIGHATIDVKDCFKNPDVYHFNQVLKLEGPSQLLGKYRTFGSVYIQAKFQKEGTADQDNFANMLINLDQHLKQSVVNGKLIIYAGHGKYLLREGGLPDPFLRFTFPSKKTEDTKTAKNTNFPEWKQLINAPIKMSRKDAGFVDVEIRGNDLIGSTELGKVSIDVEPCYAAPNTWAINKVFTVLPPKDKESTTLLIRQT